MTLKELLLGETAASEAHVEAFDPTEDPDAPDVVREPYDASGAEDLPGLAIPDQDIPAPPLSEMDTRDVATLSGEREPREDVDSYALTDIEPRPDEEENMEEILQALDGAQP